MVGAGAERRGSCVSRLAGTLLDPSELTLVRWARSPRGSVVYMARTTPVREVMTTDVLTLDVDMTIDDAVRRLSERGISGAPVVDPEGRLIGLLDDTDLLLSEARLHAPTTIELLGAYITFPGESQRYEEQVRQALAQTVESAMEDDVESVTDDATVETVATIMVDRHVSRVPVVDSEGRVIGIITRGDLVGALYRRNP